MQFSQSNEAFIVTGKLPRNPELWKLDPEDRVEINFMTPEGERRIVMSNLRLDMNIGNLMILQGECEVGGKRNTVYLRLRRFSTGASNLEAKSYLWDIRFSKLDHKLSQDVDIVPDLDLLLKGYGWLPELLFYVRWIALAWLLILGIEIVFANAAYPLVLRQIFWIGAVMVISYSYGWFKFRTDSRLGPSYFRYAVLGLTMVVSALTVISFA